MKNGVLEIRVGPRGGLQITRNVRGEQLKGILFTFRRTRGAYVTVASTDELVGKKQVVAVVTDAQPFSTIVMNEQCTVEIRVQLYKNESIDCTKILRRKLTNDPFHFVRSQVPKCG